MRGRELFFGGLQQRRPCFVLVFGINVWKMSGVRSLSPIVILGGKHNKIENEFLALFRYELWSLTKCSRDKDLRRAWKVVEGEPPELYQQSTFRWRCCHGSRFTFYNSFRNLAQLYNVPAQLYSSYSFVIKIWLGVNFHHAPATYQAAAKRYIG